MNSNLYIFAGESYMVRDSLKKLKLSLDIAFPEINITEFRTMPKADELIEACCAVPLMSDKRLVIVTDCTALALKEGGKKSKKAEAVSEEEENDSNKTADDIKKPDESKKIADSLHKIPDFTILVLCTDIMPDKRKALYNQVKKQGTVKEFNAPERDSCIRFVQVKAKECGVSISAKAASDIVAAAGCDYYTLDNEILKLAACSSFGEITAENVAECASKSLEYNVFELHNFLIKKQAGKAKKLLEDILRSERPEGLVGLIARKVRDMYKVKAMTEKKYTSDDISKELKLNSYIIDIIKKECAGFSQQELRAGLIALADLDYGIKSGEADALLKLPETIIKIYKL